MLPGDAGRGLRSSTDMWVLGITGSHNAAAALVRDGRVVVAVQAERLTRQKRQQMRLDQLGSISVELIRYCLDYAGIELGDVERIATCTPWSMVHASFEPEVLQQLTGGDGSAPAYVSVPHHLAHAEYVLHYSRLDPGLILICDGSGTWTERRAALDIQEIEDDAFEEVFLGDEGPAKESISAYRFEEGGLRTIFRVSSRRSTATPEGSWLDSFGHLWRWVARYCHGSVHDAGKVMGLAAYGDPNACRDLRYLSIANGRIELAYAPLLERFREPNPKNRDPLEDAQYPDLAAHLQKTTEDFLARLVRHLQTRFPTDRLYYSGGVALNSIANDHLIRTLGLDLHVNGSCEDNGTAIGAALAAWHQLTGERVPEEVTEYYGRAYSAEEIAAGLREAGLEGRTYESDDVLQATVRAIAEGRVVGWFQGRSEFGPRALGNRSILADPRRSEMKDVLNSRVKFREGFRPFAPAVLEERAEELFDLGGGNSPLMLRIAPVRVRSLPAITHHDGTARVQTVNARQNPRLYRLIERFEAETGVPVVVNTSFNVAGEPIVETPRDAIRTFLHSGMDTLVLGDTFVQKE